MTLLFLRSYKCNIYILMRVVYAILVIMLLVLTLLLAIAAVRSHVLHSKPIQEKYNCSFCEPEQIHLAFGEKSNDIVVVWSTMDNSVESRVKFGVGQADQEVAGSQTLFTDGGPLKRQQWIHRAVLNDLEFNTSYVYHCGSAYGWSERLSFRTPPAGEDWVVTAAIFGDLGLANAHSLSYLQEDTEAGLYDFVVHVGDFAYDMHADDARVGDQFMRQMQPIAGIVPYMVCPGNHEAAYNFSNYKARFSMPGGHDNLYTSWDVGPVHFVGFSTEFYYDNDTTSPHWFHWLKLQYHWIAKNLAEANKPENREKRPWIIMYAHRPMYCSSTHNECPLPDVPQRSGSGLPEPGYGIEPLLKQYGVDLIIFGHEHSFERTWPLYDHQVYNGSYDQPYVNPRAPVHFITGSAGCSEETYEIKKKKPWTATASSDYGYTKFKAFNKTHLYLEQISVDKKGQVIDAFWLIKEHHKPYDI